MRSTLHKTNTLSYIFIVLAHWSNSRRIYISPHSDTLSWFRTNQFLLFLVYAARLEKKQQIPISLIINLSPVSQFVNFPSTFSLSRNSPWIAQPSNVRARWICPSSAESDTILTLIRMVSGCVLPGLYGFCEWMRIFLPCKTKPCTNNGSLSS